MSCELPELRFSHEIDISLACGWQTVAEHARHVKLHAVVCLTWCLPNLQNAVCYLLYFSVFNEAGICLLTFQLACTRKQAASCSTSEAKEEQQTQWVSCWSRHT